MDVESFIPETQSYQQSEDRAKGVRVCFPWEDLVKTLKLDMNVQWIEVTKYGIFFCEKR